MKKCTYCGKESPDEMEVCPRDEQPLTPLPRTRPPQSPPLLNSIKNLHPVTPASQPTKPHGRPAISTIVIIGVICFLGLVMVGLLLPALAAAQHKALQIHCAANLQQISKALNAWSDVHKDTLPKSLLELTNEIVDPGVFVCPEDKKHFSVRPAVWDTNNFSYEFLLLGASAESTDDRVMIRCPIHGIEFHANRSLK